MRLPKLAIDNFQFTIIVFILIIIAGISSFLTMPKTEDPVINVPGASIVVIYPGASSVDLEQLIAQPVEDAINELEDIKRIITTLQDGLAVFAVEFYFGTDANEKFDEVVQKINSVKPELPDDILELDVMEWKTSDVVILHLALVSENIEYGKLKDEAEKLKKLIQKINGVQKVEIIACPEQEVRISLDMEKMAQMNISIDHVEKAIMSNNANIPGGSIKLSNKSFGIKTSGSYNDLDEIRNTVVYSYNGRLIYLRNIAEVNFDYEDNNYFAKVNGERAIFITVKQKEGFNVFKVMDQINKNTEAFKKDLDPDIKLSTVFDQSVGVDKRINGFMVSLLQGIALVGLVILLALGIKSSLIVIIAIPLSIIMGLSFVDMFGFGIQQISIAGLVVVLGLLVDNSIVMTENISRFIAMGFKPRDAAIKGASEIGWPIVSATLTTVLAFIPIIMMPEKSGAFIKSLPVTIVAVLTVSLFIALTLTPLIASKTFKGVTREFGNSSQRKGFVRFLRKFIEGPYRKSLKYVLNHRALTIFLALAILIGSLFLSRFVGISFFPKAEKPQFMVRIDLPEGTSLDHTEEVAMYVESVIDTIDEVQYFATNVGHGNPRIYYNVFSRNYAKNFAEIFVQLKEYEVDAFNELITQLRNTFSTYPGAQITIKEFEQGPPVESPVMIYINGNNMEVLRSIADDVEGYLEDQPGAINIDSELAKSRIDIHFNINKDKAGLYGVPVVQIDKTIRTAINGNTVSKYRDKEGEEYNIVLRLPVEKNITVEDFDKIYVSSISGRQIPIRQLVNIEFREVPSVIKRFDFDRTALITADIEKWASLDDVMNPVIDKLDNYPFPSSYGYFISGELESREDSFGGMQIAIVIAMISIFAVLVLQFKSFSQPLIIYSAIPFAAIGMIWALLITGYTFSFTAFIGLISLVGIVINNSIILVDYINRLRNSGENLISAIQKAGEIRFTPIILTTLTTIGGLLPLTLRGGTLWAPMGWTIIGGLLVSTFLTLLVVPVLYRIFTKEKKYSVISDQ